MTEITEKMNSLFVYENEIPMKRLLSLNRRCCT